MAVMRDSIVVEANDRFLGLLGYDRSELVGEGYALFLTPESVLAADERVARRASGNPQGIPCTYKCVKKSGEFVYLEALALPWPTDAGLAIVVCHDVTSREQDLSALEQSEKLYRLLADNIPAGIVLSDSSGNALYANRQLSEMSGYSIDEILGRVWFVHPDDPHALALCRQAFIDSKTSPRHETRIVTKDGREVWVSLLFAPVNSDDGSFEGVTTVFQDISDRKLAEERLRANEQFLQAVFDGIQDGISISDLDLNILSANRWMEDMFSAARPLRGRKCYEAYRGRSEPCEDCPSVRAMRTKLIQSEMLPWLRDGGEQVGWMELSALPLVNDDGEVWGVMEHMQEVTSRVMAEKQLREAEERYRLLADNASDLLWQMDLQGLFTYMSPSVRRYGYTPEEWVGRPLDTFLHPDELETYHERLRADLGRPGPRCYEVRMLQKNGDTVWAEVLVDVIIEDGRPCGAQGISRDITERKASEEAVRAAHERLQEAYTLQAEFLNNVTHEVRTPLTAVQGYAKMLLDGLAGSLNDEQSGLLKKSLASADNLLSIVDSVLEITRLRSGRIDLRPAVCKPGMIAMNAVSTVYPQAQARGIDLHVSAAKSERAGMYDEAKLLLILTNLLSNAVKFTESGSIAIRVSSSRDGAEFVVTDTGMGIDSQDIPAVFEEFVQGSDRRKHKPQGFGVGLALVAALVRAIGATLILSSCKDVGTAITIHVPVLDAP